MVTLNCFVAMAFGQSDTDLMYINGIEESAKEGGYLPTRIDRKNHNDRIDQRIQLEIQKSDFMIADLTYARPSVYYEAGFAERGMPKRVIYTCREDHFENKDQYQKIHFDLQNANIIPWNLNKLDIFTNKLTERVNLITKDIRLKKELDEKLKKAELGFSQQSLTLQNQLITELTFAHLLQKGFLFSKNSKQLIFHKNIDGTHFFVLVAKCRNWIQSELSLIYRKNFQIEFISKPKTRTLIYNGFRIYSDLKAIRNLTLVPSIRNIPQERIDKALPDFGKNQDRFHYFREPRKPYKGSPNDSFFPSSQEIVFMQEIKSEIHLDLWFQKVFTKVIENNQPIFYP